MVASAEWVSAAVKFHSRRFIANAKHDVDGSGTETVEECSFFFPNFSFESGRKQCLISIKTYRGFILRLFEEQIQFCFVSSGVTENSNFWLFRHESVWWFGLG